MSIIHSACWLFLDRLLRMGVGFGVGIVLARTYGPEGYGTLSYAIAIASVFGSLASLGFDDLLPRDLAANDRSVPRHDAEKTALILRLGAEFIAYILLLGFVWSTQGLGPLFWIATVYGTYFLLQATDVIEFGRRVDGDFGGIARLRLGASLFSGTLKILAAGLGLPLLAVAFAMIAEYVYATIHYLWKILKNPAWKTAHWHPAYAKSLLGRSGLMVISGILSVLQARIDSLLIERSLGTAPLGHYAAALRMVELFDALGIVLSILLIPEFGRRQGVALERFARLAYLGGGLLFLIAIPGLFLLWSFFPWVYGSRFSEGQSVMPWLSPRPLFYLIGMIRMGLLLAEQHYWRIPLYAGCAVATTSLLFAPLTARYGIEGAAMAGTVGIILSSLGLDLLIDRNNLRRLILSPLAFPDLLKFGAIAIRRRPHEVPHNGI